MPKGKKENKSWETEIPEFTREQQLAQNEILRNLGKERKTNARVNNFDITYTLGTRIGNKHRREFDTPTFSDIANCGDS